MATADLNFQAVVQVYQVGWGDYAKFAEEKSPIDMGVWQDCGDGGGLTRGFWAVLVEFIFGCGEADSQRE